MITDTKAQGQDRPVQQSGCLLKINMELSRDVGKTRRQSCSFSSVLRQTGFSMRQEVYRQRT